MKKYTYLFLILTLFIVGSGFDCGSSDKAKTPNGSNQFLEGDVPNLTIKGVPRQWRHTYKTPNGVSIGSVVAIPADVQPQVFKAIEYGITNQITATKAKFRAGQTNVIYPITKSVLSRRRRLITNRAALRRCSFTISIRQPERLSAWMTGIRFR